MINVRGIANNAIQPVNRNIVAQYLASTGYTTNAAGKRDPSFAAAVDVVIQAQAVSGSALKHIEGLNLQNVYRNVRMWGNTQGVVRPDAKGGDVLHFPQIPGGVAQKWLVTHVLETWPEWCSVIVCLQREPVV